MQLLQLGRAAASRLWGNLATPLGKEVEGFPMEDDPVGEFLKRKQVTGDELQEDVPELEMSVAGETAEEEPEKEPESMPPPEEPPATILERTFEQPPVEAIPLETDEQVDGEAADSGADLFEGVEDDLELMAEVGGEEPSLLGEEEAEEQASAAREPALETASQNSEGDKPTSANEGRGEGEIDSLLDVFRSEELVENRLTDLSRDMDDVSVYSLLEEMRHIAERVKKQS
jgi:hypothetical protein